MKQDPRGQGSPYTLEAWSNTTRGRRILRVVVATPGVLAFLLMLLSWLLPRTRPALWLVLAGLVLLFALQFASARKFERGPIRAAMIAFSAALLYFAVFGVLYAEYSMTVGDASIFITDRLGETFMVSASIGTATGYVPAGGGGGNAGFLAIVHAQMIVLAVGVAMSAAGAMARLAARRKASDGDRAGPAGKAGGGPES